MIPVNRQRRCFLVVLLCAPLAAPFSSSSKLMMVQQQRHNIRQSRLHATVVNKGTDDTFDFDRLRSIDSRLAALERTAPSTLQGFYEPHLTSFSVSPGSVDRVSITSTCFALQTILSSPEMFDSLVAMDMDIEQKDDVRIPIANVLKELLASDWRKDDLFQVPLLLYTTLLVDSDRKLLGPTSINEQVASKIRELITAVLTSRPRRRDGARQRYSDYIIYQTCQVLAAMYDSTEIPMAPVTEVEEDIRTADVAAEGSNKQVAGLPASAVPDGAASQIPLALARCAETSSNELCRQLAYRSAGDQTSFDIMRLAYSMLTYVLSTTSLSGTAGRELIPGQGPQAGTKTSQLNRPLVKAALAAFFDEQMENGLFDKGQPIYRSFRKTGRSVGNAFVFATDTVGSLLERLPAEDFRPHLASLQKTLSWIESHQSVEVIPDYCDPETGQCFGKPLRGWSSPHIPDSGPEAWSTAQTLTCVIRMRNCVQTLMHDDVLKEFNGNNLSVDGPSPAKWNRLLDTDLGDPTKGKCTTLKCVLENRVLIPFSNGIANPSYGAAYSAILFGPPGTAKTTICESLAEALGWDFLVIDTSVFLADGLTNVAARIRYVFERLLALEETVILFDEIEEFCLDRETPGLGMESRMLTTAMLTAINDLRRAERSIFFLATNRLRAFDSAIIRPGRFDMQLFVGTPNLEARVVLLNQRLASVPLSSEEKHIVVDKYTRYLEFVWTENAMFMNYLESKQYANAIGDIVASGSQLTEDEMSSILNAQAAVMTVRGPVRDEYIASMDLSRQ